MSIVFSVRGLFGCGVVVFNFVFCSFRSCLWVLRGRQDVCCIVELVVALGSPCMASYKFLTDRM